jgi:5'-phosphate synthase pdxT subunit
VERLLPSVRGEQEDEAKVEETIVAPSRRATDAKVEILGVLPGRVGKVIDKVERERLDHGTGDIVAVKQGNVFGTSFHPELTGDPRIHVWWLQEVQRAVKFSLET